MRLTSTIGTGKLTIRMAFIILVVYMAAFKASQGAAFAQDYRRSSNNHYISALDLLDWADYLNMSSAQLLAMTELHKDYIARSMASSGPPLASFETLVEELIDGDLEIGKNIVRSIDQYRTLLSDQSQTHSVFFEQLLKILSEGQSQGIEVLKRRRRIALLRANQVLKLWARGTDLLDHSSLVRYAEKHNDRKYIIELAGRIESYENYLINRLEHMNQEANSSLRYWVDACNNGLNPMEEWASVSSYMAQVHLSFDEQLRNRLEELIAGIDFNLSSRLMYVHESTLPYRHKLPYRYLSLYCALALEYVKSNNSPDEVVDTVMGHFAFAADKRRRTHKQLYSLLLRQRLSRQSIGSHRVILDLGSSDFETMFRQSHDMMRAGMLDAADRMTAVELAMSDTVDFKSFIDRQFRPLDRYCSSWLDEYTPKRMSSDRMAAINKKVASPDSYIPIVLQRKSFNTWLETFASSDEYASIAHSLYNDYENDYKSIDRLRHKLVKLNIKQALRPISPVDTKVSRLFATVDEVLQAGEIINLARKELQATDNALFSQLRESAALDQDFMHVEILEFYRQFDIVSSRPKEPFPYNIRNDFDIDLMTDEDIINPLSYILNLPLDMNERKSIHNYILLKKQQLLDQCRLAYDASLAYWMAGSKTYALQSVAIRNILRGIIDDDLVAKSGESMRLAIQNRDSYLRDRADLIVLMRKFIQGLVQRLNEENRKKFLSIYERDISPLLSDSKHDYLLNTIQKIEFDEAIAMNHSIKEQIMKYFDRYYSSYMHVNIKLGKLLRELDPYAVSVIEYSGSQSEIITQIKSLLSQRVEINNSFDVIMQIMTKEMNER